ncbi:MAG: hypothetical protein GC193_06390 [Cryomorphaceae bacterium]|nr:hypothetical protein [Cryomorphaceae bacterium]
MTEDQKIYHLNNLKTALLSVAPEYFGIPAIQGQIHLNERAFAFELYHQLRLIYTGHNWYVHGELRKGLTFLPNYQLENTLVPDLVVHHHETTDNDIIAIEIKSDPKVTGPELIEDLEKLEIYTRPGDGHLNYQIGILLVTNCDFRNKFSNMRVENRNRIIELLDFHRIAIWNINIPIPGDDYGDRIRLREDCLEIIIRHNIE